MFDKLRELFKQKTSVVRLPGCDKPNCIRYSEWEISDKVPSAWKLPEKWNKDDTKLSYTLTDCAICTHFKGFDLYRQLNAETVEPKKKKANPT